MKLNHLLWLLVKGWWILSFCTLGGYWVGMSINTQPTVKYSTIGGFEVKLPRHLETVFRNEYSSTSVYREMLLDNQLGFRQISPFGVCCVEAITDTADQGKEMVSNYLNEALSEAQETMLARLSMETPQDYATTNRLKNEAAFITKILTSKRTIKDPKPLILLVTSGIGLLAGMLFILIVYRKRLVGG